MLSLDDTIVAIASAPGGAARGMVRISGPTALGIVAGLFDRPLPTSSAQRVGGQLRLPAPLWEIPAEVYCWPTTRSYTRQPVAEIHTLGSSPILNEIVRALAQGGARLAEPGEFTLRAFLAGRLDLTQAEAVLGVIDARGRSPLDAALAQLAGGLSAPLHALRNRLLDVLAQVEAALDFVDEDIEFISSSQLDQQLQSAEAAIAATLAQLAARATSDELPRVVLVGQPNVGKSSLLNVLAGHSAAITSPQSGTTRDYVAQMMEADGVRFELIDTAGLDDPLAGADANSPDREAQSTARRQHTQADLRIFCLDATRPPNDSEQAMLRQSLGEDCMLIETKCDLVLTPAGNTGRLRVSALTGQGLPELKQAIAGKLADQTLTAAVAGTAERCRESLRLAGEALAESRTLVAASAGDELVAAEVRTAITELGKVVGTVYTEDLLDRIFSRFCIGK